MRGGDVLFSRQHDLQKVLQEYMKWRLSAILSQPQFHLAVGYYSTTNLPISLSHGSSVARPVVSYYHLKRW
jgi:hypothetical protein